jgi:hypothetical protein
VTPGTLVAGTRRRDDAPLRRCTGDPEGFLRDVWGRRAALHRGADPGGFADLLSLDDVDRVLSTSSLRTPTFRLVKAGERIPESSYTRSGRTGSRPVSGMADPIRIFELFEQGATIVLQGLHRYWEPVARFVRGLELELGHPCQVNAYVTPPGAQGLALHHDAHDVFVLQAFGAKRWEVHAAPREDERDPIVADLGTGDTIYLPTGTPHAAATQDTISGHLTVGVHVTPWREVLGEAWERLAADPSLDEGVPVGWTADPDAFAEELRGRLRDAGAALAGIDPGAIAAARRDRFLSTRPPLLRGALVDRMALGAIRDGTELARRPGSVCALRPSADRLVVLLGDRRLEMPAWLEPAMRRIAGAERFAVGDLAPEIADPQSRLVLVRRLVREGLLTIEREA